MPTVLTDNGTHSPTPGNICSAAEDIRLAIQNGELSRAHAFEYACAKAEIDHRLTKPRQPWTNGQIERMNRTLKDTTVKRYHYDTHDHLREHLSRFVTAYDYARRLKTLKGLTPCKFICKTWQAHGCAPAITWLNQPRAARADQMAMFQTLHHSGKTPRLPSQKNMIQRRPLCRT